MAGVTLNDVIKKYGETQVIHGIDLEIEDGEFCVFVGPSGCGKSTLLRMVAGLEETTAGRIDIGDRDVTRLDPSDRGVAMVFQTYALYPHMTVKENMGFGLRMNKHPKAEINEKVAEASRILKLDEYLDRKPSALSGGQRQRVSIGRAIVRGPDVFLFDEPLSNLDAELRVEMRVEIARLHKEIGATMIYVTHDQVEAMTLADRIVVLDAGHIAQVGTPRELYQRPANLFVAQFIGSPRMNVMPAGHVSLAGIAAGIKDVGIRPEHIEMVAEGAGDLDGTVDVLEYLGADTFVVMQCGDAGQVTVRLLGDSDLKPGDRAGLRFPSESVHCFDEQGLAVSR